MPLSLDALAFSDIICGSLDGKLMKDNKNDLAVSINIQYDINLIVVQSYEINSNVSVHFKGITKWQCRK